MEQNPLNLFKETLRNVVDYINSSLGFFDRVVKKARYDVGIFSPTSSEEEIAVFYEDRFRKRKGCGRAVIAEVRVADGKLEVIVLDRTPANTAAKHRINRTAESFAQQYNLCLVKHVLFQRY